MSREMLYPNGVLFVDGLEARKAWNKEHGSYPGVPVGVPLIAALTEREDVRALFVASVQDLRLPSSSFVMDGIRLQYAGRKREMKKALDEAISTSVPGLRIDIHLAEGYTTRTVRGYTARITHLRSICNYLTQFEILRRPLEEMPKFMGSKNCIERLLSKVRLGAGV